MPMRRAEGLAGAARVTCSLERKPCLLLEPASVLADHLGRTAEARTLLGAVAWVSAGLLSPRTGRHWPGLMHLSALSRRRATDLGGAFAITHWTAATS